MIKIIKLLIYTILLLFLLSPFFITVPSDPITPQEYINEFEVEGGGFITLDEYTTYYIEHNPEAEETILFVHGFGGSATNWIPLFDEFQEDYHLVAIDLRGFGLSERDLGQDFSHSGQVDLLDDFVTELGIENLTLVGHSMGGNVVTMYAQEYPEKIENLILVSASIVERQDIDFFRSRALRILDYPLIKDYVALSFNLFLTSERLESMFEDTLYDPESIDISEPLFVDPTAFENWGYSLIKIIVASEENFQTVPLEDMQVPALLVWGEEDTWVPLQQGEYLEGQIEGSELKVLPEVGHLPMVESPSDLKDLIMDFVN